MYTYIFDSFLSFQNVSNFLCNKIVSLDKLRRIGCILFLKTFSIQSKTYAAHTHTHTQTHTHAHIHTKHSLAAKRREAHLGIRLCIRNMKEWFVVGGDGQKSDKAICRGRFAP